MPPTDLWDSSRLASYLGCSKRHLFNLRKRGLPSYRLGDIIRFDVIQVIAWLNSGAHTPDQDQREQQLSDLACEQNDNAECAAADLHHEFENKR